MFSGSVGKRRENGGILSFDGRLTPSSTHHAPTPTLPSPPPFHLPPIPSFFPELPGPSWLRESPGVRSLWPWFCLSPHPALVLSQLSPAFTPSLSLSSVQILLSSHYLTHFSLSLSLFFSIFQFFLSFAGSSCSWMAVLIGVSIHLHSHPLSLSLCMSLALSESPSLSLDFFCSPVYCNTQASLICVFVSVYLLLS